MKIGIIIQARTGSTRLPNKMTLPFNNGDGILTLLLSKLKEHFEPEVIVVATTQNSNDDVIERISKEANVNVFRGAEENVISRFIGASEKFGFDKVIRVCADNPFLSMFELKRLWNEFESSNELDYISFEVFNKPSILSHYGFWAEGVSVSALGTVIDSTNEKVFLEHVTNYIHSAEPDRFNIRYIEPSFELKGTENFRLTVDTLKDFENCKKLYHHLAKYDSEIQFELIKEFVKSNDEIRRFMKIEKVNNEK